MQDGQQTGSGALEATVQTHVAREEGLELRTECRVLVKVRRIALHPHAECVGRTGKLHEHIGILRAGRNALCTLQAGELLNDHTQEMLTSAELTIGEEDGAQKVHIGVTTQQPVEERVHPGRAHLDITIGEGEHNTLLQPILTASVAGRRSRWRGREE